MDSKHAAELNTRRVVELLQVQLLSSFVRRHASDACCPAALHLQASRRAPAIIFLDELDALVPCRSARAGGGDQIYASGAPQLRCHRAVACVSVASSCPTR